MSTLTPPTIGGWVGVLLGWNPYFPWYPTISTHDNTHYQNIYLQEAFELP